MYTLADVLQSSGQRDAAIELYERALRGCEVLYGAENEATRGCAASLAALLEEYEDRRKEAWELRERFGKPLKSPVITSAAAAATTTADTATTTAENTTTTM